MQYTKIYSAHLNPINFSSLENLAALSSQKMDPAPHSPNTIEFIWLQAQSSTQNFAVKFSRKELETLASKEISPLFGEWFKPLDQYKKLIRMPEPPLLLVDEVLKIEGEPGSMKTGTIWTQTTITENAWYLHQGRMPTGIMIEAGQADLLLASWLGFDLYNAGKRVYRLLGCKATFYGELPKVGDTLCFEIHIDSHIQYGDVIMFFFHYDCTINGEVRLSVRNGQAGFFSDEELLSAGGILWDPEKNFPHEFSFENISTPSHHTIFNRQQLEYFSQGKLVECFGQEFKFSQCHTATPRINNDLMLLIHEITHFDVQGGPWQRGYMRAIQFISSEDWFFKGHFKNDPCMPGTLMFEACLQTMACYLTALGLTLNKDGWRFEIVTGQTYQMQCRGQVTPSSKQIVYEIYVCGLSKEPYPTLFADVLCSADNLKVFHTRCGLRLVPDWPFSQYEKILETYHETKPVYSVNGFEFNYRSLLACALGKPSSAFGPMFQKFDSHRHIARLPGLPYHFISRITHVQGEMGCFQADSRVICEYDVPKQAWYFEDHATAVMPFAVLLEIGLQPCGWLGCFIGSPLISETDFLFRNLEGSGKQYKVIDPNITTLRTEVICKNIFHAAEMIIETFQVKIFSDQELVYEMNTTFGFFAPSAFEKQAGLSATQEEIDALNLSSDHHLEVHKLSKNHFSEFLKLPSDKLLMIEKITGFWPTGGKRNLGRIRAEKNIYSNEWFFKAHFFRDPVQPGSLGLEAMLQLLQLYVFESGLHQSFKQAQFLPSLNDCAIKWKYRGQVTPANKLVVVLLDITEIKKDTNSLSLVAEASLWVDGKKIYEASGLGLSLIEEEKYPKIFLDRYDFDPKQEAWINHHCPNYITPTLPMMSMLDWIAFSASKYFPDKKLTSLSDIRAKTWLIAKKTVIIHSKVCMQSASRAEVSLYFEKDNQHILFSSGIAEFSDQYPSFSFIPEPLINPTVAVNYYDSFFHGPYFHCIKKLILGTNGSSSILEAHSDKVPFGYLNQLLLDGTTHTIPYDNLKLWSDAINETQTAFPAFIKTFQLYSTPPQTGTVRCETRFKGFYHHENFPQFELTLYVGEKIWLQYILVEAFFPKGKLGMIAANKRRKFLSERSYEADVLLSNLNENGSTYLSMDEVKSIDWIPGSLAKLYEANEDLEVLTKQILIKEQMARQFQIHPCEISVASDYSVTHADKKHYFHIEKENDTFFCMLCETD